MNRATIALLLAVVAAEGCSAEEPLPRQVGDAGTRDTRGAVLFDVRSADRLDGSGGSYVDEDASPPIRPEPPDADVVPDVFGPPDVRQDPIVDEWTPPPPDTRPPDAPPSDGLLPPDVNDVTVDPVVLGSCLVTFSVGGVVWGDGGAVSGHVVRLVGDVSMLGAWTPASGVTLAETSSGTWSGAVTFRHLQLVQFKFVKFDNGAAPEWESWVPYDSNRSLQIDCGDGGTSPADASATGDAGDASVSGDAADASSNDGADAPDGDGRITPIRAIGNRYVGIFGVRPSDATK